MCAESPPPPSRWVPLLTSVELIAAPHGLEALLLCELVDLAKRKQAALKDVAILESDVAILGDSQADDRTALARCHRVLCGFELMPQRGLALVSFLQCLLRRT